MNVTKKLSLWLIKLIYDFIYNLGVIMRYLTLDQACKEAIGLNENYIAIDEDYEAWCYKELPIPELNSYGKWDIDAYETPEILGSITTPLSGNYEDWLINLSELK